MSDRTDMGQVKFKVRHNALLLREFTVEDIVRATRLNPESVRTELQRMRQEGLLTSEPHPSDSGKRGAPPSLYKLTEDPEARLALAESVEAFYPSIPSTEQPTSRHFESARRLLSEAQALDGPQRERLLAVAEHDLEMTSHAEGGDLASESVKAYLEYEWARLAYLRNKYEKAEERFEALRGFFVSAQNEAMVKRIDEFRLCLDAWHRFTAAGPSNFGEAAWARCLLDTLSDSHYQIESPLALLVLRLLRQLSRSAEEKVRAAAMELAIEVSRREIGEEVEELRSERLQLSSEVAMLRQEGRHPRPHFPEKDEASRVRFEDWLGVKR